MDKPNTMKKLIFISLFAIIFSCKKQSSAPTPITPTPANQQDSKLIGTWVLDSTLEDGSGTLIPSSIFWDTLKVSLSNYDHVMWTSGYSARDGGVWYTIKDSIITFPNYKYAITGNHLWTYSKRAPAVPNEHFWYHKK